ncbi:MAG: type II toxin-antitoxin system YoeB family toxin [Bifidobacteriaceae bacterium]|nr:type II toxin-antitoxin system YoeB family toxin [Bifidobacteriaceae bacterium]
MSTTLRTNLARTLDAVVDDKEEVVIARERGSAVIVDLREHGEHRLVYRVTCDEWQIAQARYHY